MVLLGRYRRRSGEVFRTESIIGFLRVGLEKDMYNAAREPTSGGVLAGINVWGNSALEIHR